MTATAARGGAVAAGEVLARYLSTQATELLRGLRDLPAQEAGAEEGAAAVAGAVHDAAFRIADTLGSFGTLLDPEWAQRLEGELYWLGATVMREHVYAARRDRLVGALRRLSGEDEPDPAAGAERGPGLRNGAADAAGALRAGGAVPGARGDGEAAPANAGVGTDAAARDTRAGTAAERRPVGGARTAPAYATRGGRPRDRSAGHAPDASAASASAAPSARGAAASGAPRAVGAARAGALLERRLGLARSRAHSEALDALTSARYHALADAVALLVSDAPLTGAARRPVVALPEHHDELRRVLAAAVAALPLARAGRPYNAAALARGLAAPRRAGASVADDDRDDAPWRHVHALVRRARHAAELLAACPPGTVPVRPAGPPLPAAGAALDRDREAVEAAAAAASAAATPRIAPATAYALGVLHADQRHEVEAARFTFGTLWQTRGEQE
ncbi:hypothetical protein O7599_22735 [Streptomyces sp. WMMC500]|uniref:hypothetical protein n=1 Tax=Streptomyces sp. WMMC500 TaxID=3015154 RepID=UPI00248C8877|nr:hypothetical protein [Streptomyces sp. WMMC500]WBB58443.1 hypothetical protein O7599_22735 [Streptomyces sp. WMMC500]